MTRGSQRRGLLTGCKNEFEGLALLISELIHRGRGRKVHTWIKQTLCSYFHPRRCLPLLIVLRLFPQTVPLQLPDGLPRWFYCKMATHFLHSSLSKLLNHSVSLMAFSLFGLISIRVGQVLLETRRLMTVVFSCTAAVSMPCLRAPGGGGWYLKFNSRRLTDATCLPAGITPGSELAAYLLLVSLCPRRLIGSKQIFHIFFLPFVPTSCSTTSLLLLFGWSPLYMQIYTYINRTNLFFFYTDKEIFACIICRIIKSAETVKNIC